MTTDQEKILLRDRLTVMKRATWLTNLQPLLASEFERFRVETANRLSELHG